MILLANTVPGLCLAAESDPVSVPQSYYSVDVFTDAFGGSTIIFDVNAALASRNRLQIGVGRSNTPGAALNTGHMFNAGYTTDPQKKTSIGVRSEFWRLLATSGNNVEIWSLSSSVVQQNNQWSVAVTPAVKRINIHKLTMPTAEIAIGSTGVSLAATYLTQGKWSYAAGIESNRYFGNAAALQNILNIIKFTGKAPFLASLVRSRYYVEADYGFVHSVVTLGLDMNRTVIETQHRPSVYVRVVSELSNSWSLQSELGINSLDASDWFLSLGLTYTR